MDGRSFQLPENRPSATSTIVYCILGLYFVHLVLVHFDYPILSPQELLWNTVVFLIPSRLLLDAARRHELRETSMLSQMHAAKGDTLRKMLGFGSSVIAQQLPGGESIMRRMSSFSSIEDKPPPATDAPPGLGNWDNSCYQNSVLQGLASLRSLRTYLDRANLKRNR